MPSKNQIKDYISDSFYHIYNRGVGKMNVFKTEKDFATFLHYLKTILSPVEYLEQELHLQKDQLSEFSKNGLKENVLGGDKQYFYQEARIRRLLHAINQAYKSQVYENVELLSFCLMPNHFHLLIYQKTRDGMKNLLHRLATSYSGYFTRVYEHVGPLYQGRYSASHLYYEPELQALMCARYIEQNSSSLLFKQAKPFDWLVFQKIEEYPFSSLKYYLSGANRGGKSPVWLNTMHLNEIFNKVKARPNGVIERRVAEYENFGSFVLGNDGLNLEDVRLAHLEGLL